MIRINLLPHREQKRKARREQFYALAILMLILGATIWFLGYTIISGQITTQEGRNSFLKSEIAALDKQIDEIKKLKQQSEALIARKQVIESLQANRAETVYLFNELARQVPSGIYLKSVKQAGSKVTLVGYSQSSGRVSNLMRNLDESPLLEKPDLVEIKSIILDKRNLFEFTLNILITRQTTDVSKPDAGKQQTSSQPQKAKQP